MEKGLKILLNTYWSNKGWDTKEVSEEDFVIAKEEGYMFEYPKYENHEEVLTKKDILLSKIDPQDVANAFLYSLSTRKLEYRSILGSYYYAKAIPKHELEHEFGQGDNCCCICGWTGWKEKPREYDLRNGLNVLNFERYKFGGVRHTKLNYSLFDLEQFIKLPKVIPTDEDKEILKNILECVEELEGKEKAGKLRDVISSKRIFKCNKSEICVILDILGICGVLANEKFHSYEERFVDEFERDPMEHKNDFAYPINRWHVSDGINYDKFFEIFKYRIDR